MSIQTKTLHLNQHCITIKCIHNKYPGVHCNSAIDRMSLQEICTNHNSHGSHFHLQSSTLCKLCIYASAYVLVTFKGQKECSYIS